jgi:phosphoglycolate phosphatase
MNKIILFDIDGTLLHSGSELGKIHHTSFLYGFKNVYDVEVVDEDFRGYSGRTDMFVIKDILKKKGFEDNEISKNMSRMFQQMAKCFRENVGEADYKETIIDGVIETLDRMNMDKVYVLGLLTGNLREIAKIKLETIGLWHYFKVGGFGDSSESRANLIDVAIGGAIKKKFVDKVDMKQVYIVGDTKHDILCAKERGAISVAVSTGRFTKADLEIYKPDYLLANLSELIPTIPSL